MKYTYNKLVRDKIPANIDSTEGRKANWRIMDDEEYIKELNKKLLEEAHEFIEENAVEELADIMEVIQSIMRVKNISYEELKKVQALKREQKGGFNDRVYLIDVEQDKVDEREEQEMKKDWRKNSLNERWLSTRVNRKFTSRIC